MLSHGPPGIKERKKLKGSRGKGKTYERKLERHLRDLVAGGAFNGQLGSGPPQLFSQQWLCFKDASGTGWAQPDFYLLGSERILLIESKLTYSMDGDHQLQYLYGPLLEHLYGLPVLKLQAFKNLRGCRGPRLIEDLAARFELEDELLGWHFMGM